MEEVFTKGLTKSYGTKGAVDNMKLVVPKGAIYDFIGRNGEWKTTTQKMVCGLAHSLSFEVHNNNTPQGRQSNECY